MPTARIRNARKHAAKRARALLPNPAIPPHKLNKTGITLSAREYRKVRAAVERINRGEVLEFETAEEAVEYIFGRK